MDLRKHTLEAITLIAAAVACALISNTIASRERKIVLVGTYPNALKVPPAAPETTIASPTTGTSAALPPSQSVTTATTATAVTTRAVIPLTATTATTATQPRNLAPSQPAPTSPVPASPHAASAPAAAVQAASTQPALKQDLSKYQPHPDKAYLEIPYKDVAALHAGGALFLDARRTSIYEQGHIAGARSFSVWESDADDKVRGLWEQRQDPKEQALPIVVYCSGGDCEDSHMLAQKLWGAQFNNVYVYKDGFPDWQSKGGTVHTGGTP